MTRADPSRPTRRRAVAPALALACALAAPALAFGNLDPGQRQLLAPLAGAGGFVQFVPRAGLRANAAHWLALPPDEQRALVARMRDWDALPAAERARRRAPFAAWQALTVTEQTRLRALAARVAALPEAERRVLRAGFDALPADERQDWWLGPRIGADFAGLRPLFAFLPEGERPALLEMLRGLSEQARTDLAELARRVPANQRAALRQALLATPPAGREAMIRERLGR